VDDTRRAVADAIRSVRSQVRWKPGKDLAHLEKRKAMGHLPAGAGMSAYDAVVRTLVHDPEARVFAYRFGDHLYATALGNLAGRAWLAIFSLAGVMETAFPPDDVAEYLAQPGYTELGTIGELLP
jgi:hypothetical protein